MRLLQRLDTGVFGLTEDLLGNDTIPPYAILSHTWVNGQEVTYQDLAEDTGKDKSGYDKLRFCAEQAKRDGLQYFWVDTCCIDKTNSAELSREINAMFHRYSDASRCYVYLLDVPCPPSSAGYEQPGRMLESAFRRSRWFTRGWTLQELLAPTSVEFFSSRHEQSYEYTRLGDKSSLKQWIHEITGIPHSALEGSRMSQFSVEERFLWSERRQTTEPEDKIYSLLGIFDVKIPLYYGEGAMQAYTRLREVIEKWEKCMQDLCVTDPRDDKKRIQETKGGLLEDSYRWILENSDFRQWHSAQQNTLLWVKGDPGKGKTMLLCGVIDKLEEAEARTGLLSYFFCQATDARINNGTAVLRGLIHMLVRQQPSLISHVRKKHDQVGSKVFADANAWVALCEMFIGILQDSSLPMTYIVIDALDECVADLPKLLGYIARLSTVPSRVKWIVSSRNWHSIEEQLGNAGPNLSLELNAKSISIAVGIYIQYKVNELAQRKKYNDKMRQAVLLHLSSNADDTFLWVALVCQNLEEVSQWEVLEELKANPPGLDPLYERMLKHICDSRRAGLCKQILALIATVFRPITLKELTSLVKLPENMFDELQSLRELIGHCGSFLTIRNDTIYFVHQSAKEYLSKNEEAQKKVFPSGMGKLQYKIFSRSLSILSRTLRRDIYNLRAPGYPIKQVERPNSDPLAVLRYPCIYWVDHFREWISTSGAKYDTDLQNGGRVDKFLRQKYLYWVEALSLCKNMSAGLHSMVELQVLIQGRADGSTLIKLVQDAYRFITYHKWAIENNPLQAYASALVFSPANSLIKNLFMEEEVKSISLKPAMRKEWGACLQTLEGHGGGVRSVAFSPDSQRLASGSNDGTVKIWDASDGACLQTLEGHGNEVRSVAFSPDSQRLASGSDDGTVKIWDARSGLCLYTLGIGTTLKALSFDSTGSYLRTDIGAISIDTVPAFSTRSTRTDAQKPRYVGVGLSSDRTWITYKSENLVWLPSEYRPTCSVVLETSVGCGTASGKVYVCKDNNIDDSQDH